MSPDPYSTFDAEADARRSHLRRGWYWGSQAFAERALNLGEAMLQKKRHRSSQGSQESRAHGEREAERLLREGLKAAGLRAAALPGIKGSDPRKVTIARVIWQKTTVRMEWIAAHLEMKSAANASQQLRREQTSAKNLPPELQRWLILSENVA